LFDVKSYEIKQYKEKAHGGNSLKILIAEDNYINQKLLRRMLNHLGFEAEVCENGQEVLDFLNENKVDVIFMDVQMPVKDGFETTREIVETMGENRPKIIALTASALQSDMQKCLEAGMDDYIAKPIMMDILEEKLNKWKPES
jgi:multi-sensor hybrid histidine kinase (EC 2.7.13.3)